MVVYAVLRRQTANGEAVTAKPHAKSIYNTYLEMIRKKNKSLRQLHANEKKKSTTANTMKKKLMQKKIFKPWSP